MNNKQLEALANALMKAGTTKTVTDAQGDGFASWEEMVNFVDAVITAKIGEKTMQTITDTFAELKADKTIWTPKKDGTPSLFGKLAFADVFTKRMYKASVTLPETEAAVSYQPTPAGAIVTDKRQPKARAKVATPAPIKVAHDDAITSVQAQVNGIESKLDALLAALGEKK